VAAVPIASQKPELKRKRIKNTFSRADYVP
jgi:hypothetical protein